MIAINKSPLLQWFQQVAVQIHRRSEQFASTLIYTHYTSFTWFAHRGIGAD